MILRHSNHPLPRLWSGNPKAPGIIGEAEIKVSHESRVRAKVLVFEKRSDLKNFWKNCLGNDAVCKRTQALVSALAVKRIKIDKDGIEESEIWEVDRRYFCIMGFIRKYLRMEVVVHESIHAGFAYAARQNRREWSKGDAMDEEEVCYPAARIASCLNRWLYDHDLYP